MKLFLILSLFITNIISFSLNEYKEQNDQFILACNDGYNNYVSMKTEETNNYYLNIVVGEIEEKIGYSILFISSNPNEYDIKLCTNKKEYLLPKNSRKDVVAYNIVMNEDYTIQVHVNGISTYSYDVNYLTYDDFISNYKDQLIKGNNLGFTQTNLKEENNDNYIQILSLIFIGIILISGGILLFLFITKKGLFNSKKRDQEFEEQHQIRDEIQNFFNNLEKEETIEVEVIDEEVKEVYEKAKFYDEEDFQDVSLLLKEKGFNVEYKTLTTEEKNKVMLELMRMKDSKEITEEEYKEEIIKLWM